mmetsp:Transcript_28521/g.65904  ORF Transcript_28521/g.65904 Transcript_28521/m.65904 type:complete len:226 (-) Transcript_28521:49-726(-)
MATTSVESTASASTAVSDAAQHVTGLRAVIFDFDQTLTVVPAIAEHKIKPRFDDKLPNMGYLVEAFGGAERLKCLLQALAALRSQWQTELIIVSFEERDLILAVLRLIGADEYFGLVQDGLEGSVFGWQEVWGAAGRPVSNKGHFIAALMEARGWSKDKVLFIDDQPDNIKSATPVCRTHWVREAKGMTMEDIHSLQTTGCIGFAPSSAAPSVPSSRAVTSVESV